MAILVGKAFLVSQAVPVREVSQASWVFLAFLAIQAGLERQVQQDSSAMQVTRALLESLETRVFPEVQDHEVALIANFYCFMSFQLLLEQINIFDFFESTLMMNNEN